MEQQTHTEARERVMIVADQLFAKRGYQAVTLRDIAQQLGIRHTSLYYHFPHGKEELFVEVTKRRMQSYHAGLEQTIQQAGANWVAQLRAVAFWLLEQPAMHLGRMLQSDMPVISGEASEQLRHIVFASLLQPLEAIFHVALSTNSDLLKRQRGATIAGMFLSLIEGIENLPPSYIADSKQELVDTVLDILINGIRN